MRRGAALAFVLALTSTAAAAHDRSDAELRLLARLPKDVVDGVALAEQPDSIGNLYLNRARWRGVMLQRYALPGLELAAARGDEVLGERMWLAVDAAFEHQLPDGSFSSAARDGDRAARSASLDGTTLWLGDLSHALLILDQGPLRGWFGKRIERLLPKVHLAGQALARDSADLRRRHARDAGLLLADAQAFGFTGELFHDGDLLKLGRESLLAALALQRANGAFPAGAHAPTLNTQAAAMLRLRRWALQFPDPFFDAPLDRGAQWLVAHAAPESRGGLAELASANERMLALLYEGTLRDDARLLAAARRSPAGGLKSH